MKKYTYIATILILAESILIYFLISSNRNIIDAKDQNIRAKQGLIDSLVLRNGNLVKSRDSYILKWKEVVENFDITKKEYKEREKFLKSKIAALMEADAEVKIDTISIIKDSIIVKDTNKIFFSYRTKWIAFDGKTDWKDETVTINNLFIPVPVRVGITNDYKFWIECDNPYVNIKYLNSAIINGEDLYKKKRKFSGGVQCGWGMSYDLIRGNGLGMGPYVGVGLQWNF